MKNRIYGWNIKVGHSFQKPAWGGRKSAFWPTADRTSGPMVECVERFTKNLSALIPNQRGSQMAAYLRILECLRCSEHPRFSIKRVDSGGTTRRSASRISRNRHPLKKSPKISLPFFARYNYPPSKVAIHFNLEKPSQSGSADRIA